MPRRPTPPHPPPPPPPYDFTCSPAEHAPYPMPISPRPTSVFDESMDWRSVKCVSGVLNIFQVISHDTQSGDAAPVRYIVDSTVFLKDIRYIVDRHGAPVRVDGEASCVLCGAQWPKFFGRGVDCAWDLNLVQMSNRNIRCGWCWTWAAEPRTNITVCDWLGSDDIHWRNESSVHRSANTDGWAVWV